MLTSSSLFLILNLFLSQDILRNKWGRTIDCILSKDETFDKLNDTRQELLEKIGLTFNELGEVVVGYVDIEKYLTLFISQSGVQSAITAPNSSIIIMDYIDSFPWLKWSHHFTGEISVRVKIIEPYNLLSTVLTVSLWLGNDDYDTVKECAGAVHELSGKAPSKEKHRKFAKQNLGNTGCKNICGTPLSE